MSGQIRGSHIWKLAWENRGIVQQHCFWEIRAGDRARFLEDSWQQEPILNKNDLAAHKSDIESKGLLLVKDLWD